MLCATMAVTTTMGVDLGFSWVFLGVFPFDFLSYSCYSKNLGKLQIGPLESLGHRESGTAIPSSGDSSQPSNEPFEGGHSTPFSRHFLNKKILWTSFLDPNFLVLSLSPWGGRKLWPPFGANFETRRKLQSQQTRQLEREDERAEAQLFSGRFDINLVALWVGKERALKPFLQLFITLDQKVCLIPELRFPIPTLLNKKKVIFLPPVDFFSKN